jgi:uncharacterized membrane protein (UPF0127 family)
MSRAASIATKPEGDGSLPRAMAWVAASGEGRQRLLAVVERAETALTRMQGLLGRDALADGEGLVLTPCSSVHTWFMRFPIDVLFLDRQGRVVRGVDALKPFRFAWGGWQARSTIELPAGTLRRAGVRVGHLIRIEEP